MGGCDPVTFHNVNQSVFDCIKKKLSDAYTSCHSRKLRADERTGS